MKFLRLGSKGKETPAIVDKENNYRDLSSLVEDFKPSTLNFETLKKIKDSNISKFPIISKDQRIGACVSKPGKFIGIGLNYDRFNNKPEILLSNLKNFEKVFKYDW